MLQLTLTGEDILILFSCVVMLYWIGWLVVNKIVPYQIRRRSAKRREERKNKKNDDDNR